MTSWGYKSLPPSARASSYLANGLCRLGHDLDLEAIAEKVRRA